MNCLIIGLALSMHVGLQNDYNQYHPYVMCKKEDITGGVYYNSLDKASVVLAKEYQILPDLSDDLKLDVGIATGYIHDVVPLVRLHYKDFFVMPALEDDRTGVVFGFQYEFKLK
jgi:hypothetical protein